MRDARILVVDDHATNAKLLAYVVRAHGYAVETAFDAEGALSSIDTWHPHLILMDVQLPGIDGLELTRRVKSNPATRDIVVIAVTAFAMKGDQAKVLAAGCDDYISKPIDTRSLPETIARHLSRWEPGS